MKPLGVNRAVSPRQRAKSFVQHVLNAAHILPSVWAIGAFFKIHEYRCVLQGANLQEHHDVLDLGCGGGKQTQLLATHCRTVTGVDISATQIAKAKRLLLHSQVEQKTTFLCGALQSLRLPDSSFDRVISFCVLEHIPDLDVVLSEVYRILRPGGELHASVDSLGTISDPGVLDRHRHEHAVVQYFTPASLSGQVSAAGFEVREVFPILKGDFVRQEFERRVINGYHTRGFLRKVRAYWRLRREDEHVDSDRGIMLVVRARRGIGP